MFNKVIVCITYGYESLDFVGDIEMGYMTELEINMPSPELVASVGIELKTSNLDKVLSFIIKDDVEAYMDKFCPVDEYKVSYFISDYRSVFD